MKSIKEAFSEVTDIDSVFVRTTIALFSRPEEVVTSVLANEATFVKPLRYVLITSSIYSFLAIVFNSFGPEDRGDIWRHPAAILEFNHKLAGFTDNFFPFILLVSGVPLSVLLLKLLYFKKSVGELFVIMLYSFGLLWLITLPMELIPATPLDGIIHPFIIFTIVCALFRKVMGGNLVLLLGKWSVTFCVTICCFYYIVTPVVEFLYAELAGEKSTVIYKQPDDSDMSFALLDTILFDVHWNAVKEDKENRSVFLIEEDSVTRVRCVSENFSLLWEQQKRFFSEVKLARLVSLPGSRQGILLLGLRRENSDSSALQRMIIFHEDGKVFCDTTFDRRAVINDGVIIGNMVVMAGGMKVKDEIHPVILKMAVSNGGDITESSIYTLARIGRRFNHLYPMNFSSGRMEFMLDSYDIAQKGFNAVNTSEIDRLSILNVAVDTAIHVKWETPVFDKANRYSPPLENVKMSYDSVQHMTVIAYSLSDHYASSVHMIGIDSGGKILWEQKIRNGEFNHLEDIVQQENWIYFCGSSSWFTPQHPFVQNYRLALAGRIRPDGSDYSQTIYGEYGRNVGVSFLKLIPRKSGLLLYTRMSRRGMFGRQWQSGMVSSAMLTKG